jgi:hypothetical protein
MLREGPARHARARAACPRRRAAAGFGVLAALGIAVPAAALWLGTAVSRLPPVAVAGPGTGRTAADSRPASGPLKTPEPPVTTVRIPVLSPRARRSCPHAASACVDLTDRLTWLQSGSGLSYGPVRMEPGPPGTSHASPRGIFHVAWKAGAHYLSTEYREAMPYAVFFAEGGIAFHGGSLTRQSHGCIHLSIRSARYYHDHLPVGAEVAVF